MVEAVISHHTNLTVVSMANKSKKQQKRTGTYKENKMYEFADMKCTVTVPLNQFLEMKEYAKEWLKWVHDAQWGKDNNGQMIIYTGLNEDGIEIDFD